MQDPFAPSNTGIQSGQLGQDQFSQDPFGAGVNGADPNANLWQQSGQFGQDQFSQNYGQPDLSQFGAPAGTDFSAPPTGGIDNSFVDFPQPTGNVDQAIPTDNSGGGYGSGDTSGGSYDPSAFAAPSDYSSGDSGGDSSYAQGGAIPGATTGGHVPQSASPSGGRNTDDIHANLNADEFVVPKDVSRWKGEEFFHKMIADSRMKRTQAQQALGVGGQMKPQAPGPVTFQSHRIDQR